MSSTTDQARQPSEWLDWLLVPFSLLLGALLGLGAVTGFHLAGWGEGDSPPLTWKGSELEVVTGKGQVKPQGLELTALGGRGQAALKLSLPSEEIQLGGYRVLRIHTTGLAPASTRLGLAWRETLPVKSGRVGGLPALEAGTQELSVDVLLKWQGPADALALLVQGSLPQPLTIERIDLLPWTLPRVLHRIWADWTTFEGWSTNSINYIVGGALKPLISPVAAAALWVGLSMALYAGVLRLQRRRWRLAPFALIFLAGWFVVDLRWQVDLLRQIPITREQFAGKSDREKHLASSDRGLFEFAERAKQELPDSPARVYLAPLRDGYTRSRLHYLLLPHNVGSLWSVPPIKINPEDYVIVERGHQRISYAPEAGELRWVGNAPQALAAQQIFSSPVGSFYRAGSGSLAAHKPARASDVRSDKDATYSAEQAVDDDPSTEWAAGDAARSAWLEVDLLQPTTFSRIWVSEVRPSVKRFQLECRDAEGEPWRVAVAGATLGTDFSTELPPVTARYVRLQILEASAAPRIKEFRVFEGS